MSRGEQPAGERSSQRAARLAPALLVGLGYFVIARVSTLPAGHVRAWRLAAWLASAALYEAHLGFEHFTLGNRSRAAASHAAVAVAVGALGLALWGMIRSLLLTGSLRPTWLLALVAWPAITAIPAFVVALAASAALARLAPVGRGQAGGPGARE